MTAGWIAFLTFYGVLYVCMIARHLYLTSALRQIPQLLPLTAPPTGELPLVSILVPAKDEAGAIENCLRSLLLQDHPRFEILVVNDRSTDATPELVAKIAAADPRVRLINVTELPAGWTGKTHALHLGQQQARGTWLLFVDADVQLESTCVRAAIADSERHGTDLFSLMPALRNESFFEQVVQPFAGVCLMSLYPLNRVNQVKREATGFANGQFILVRRTAYDQMGGHHAVRDKFVEDIHLGRNTRRHGLHLRVTRGEQVASVRMYTSLAGIVRGWTRILYSAVDARPGRLWTLTIAIGLFSVLSYAILIIGGGCWLAGWRPEGLQTLLLLGVGHQFLQTTLMARLYSIAGSDWKALLGRIVGVAVMLWILLRTIRTCRTHRVEWRGTQYDQGLMTARLDQNGAGNKKA